MQIQPDPMTLIANRRLTGDYGTVDNGQSFDVEDATAVQLIRNGLARKCEAPTVRYETKVITPEAPEVSARPAFRDGALSDPEPAAMATEGNSLLPGADAPEQGVTDPGGRGRRRRFDPR